MRPSQTTVFENLRFAIVCDDQFSVIENATLVVAGEEIIDLGPAADVTKRRRPQQDDLVIDGSRYGVTPGFVDTHVHLSEALSRASFPDDVDTRAWVFDWVMPYYGKLTQADEEIAVRIAASEMLRCGTTTFLDMGAIIDPRVTVPLLNEVGIRGITGKHAADTRPSAIPPGWSEEMVSRHFFSSTEAALEELEACVRDVNDGAMGNRVSCWVNIQGKEPCSAELHVGVMDIARRHGVGVTYHIASTQKESQLAMSKYGMTPVARMDALGALGPNLVLAHAVAVTDNEIDILSRHETKVAFCPGTSLKLAKGATAIGRYPEMIDAGVTLGLGTDGVSASGSLNLMRQMYLAAGLFKDARMDPQQVGAKTAIRMATIEGARALGLDEQIGSLTPGKQADFVVFDLGHPEWIPYQDPAQALVWSATPASIAQTWVAGKALFKDDRVATVDEEALGLEARERAARLRRVGLPDRSDTASASEVYG